VVTLASLITVLRFPLLIIVVLMLYLGGGGGRFVAVPLIFILIMLDTLDGIIARRRGEQSLFGSALDIAADRAVEIVLWVTYAHQRLIPVAIPITVVIRGALTDSFRGIALRNGQSAHSMMRSRIGHWLVASAAMRSGYSVAKTCAFLLLALALALGTTGQRWEHSVRLAGTIFAWLSLALCLLRGLPVIAEAALLLGRRPADSQEAETVDR